MTAWIPERLGMGWEFHHPDGVRFTVGYQKQSGQYLQADHELRWENGTKIRLITSGVISINAPTTPKTLATAAERVVPSKTLKWDWQEELTSALHFVKTQAKAGRPAVDLTTLDDAGFEWMVRPYIEMGGPTRLIAAGGSRKSFLAMAMEATIATGSEAILGVAPSRVGPGLYLDWETNDHGRTHAYRLRAIARGADIQIPTGMIHHQQHDRPLAERVEGVAEFCDREGIVFVVIDSNTWARGSGGRGGLEAATLEFLEALRHINRPTLIIDHKSKEQMDKGKSGGYGFIHNENQVRLQWEYTSIHEQDPDGDVVRVKLENTKQNNIPKQPDQAFEISFENDRSDPDRPRLIAVRFRPIAAGLVRGVHPGSTEPATQTDAIYQLLAASDEPRTVTEISAITKIPEASVRTVLRRSEELFANVSTGRAGLWTTKDRDPRNNLPDPWKG